MERKPVPPPDILTSELASVRHQIAVESWGDRGWLQVARICRWAVDNGATGLTCPQPSPPPPPPP